MKILVFVWRGKEGEKDLYPEQARKGEMKIFPLFPPPSLPRILGLTHFSTILSSASDDTSSSSSFGIKFPTSSIVGKKERKKEKFSAFFNRNSLTGS